MQWREKPFTKRRSTFGGFFQVFNSAHDTYLQQGVEMSSSGISPFFRAERNSGSHLLFDARFNTNPSLKTFWTHPKYGGPLFEYKSKSVLGYRLSFDIANTLRMSFQTKFGFDDPLNTINGTFCLTNPQDGIQSSSGEQRGYRGVLQ